MNDPITNPTIHTNEFLEFIHKPPTLNEAITFLNNRYGAPEELVREWYADMEGDCWADQQGNTIRNWPSHYYRWKKNYARFAAMRAVPNEPRYGGGRRKADNWRGTRKEDIGNVLG